MNNHNIKSLFEVDSITTTDDGSGAFVVRLKLKKPVDYSKLTNEGRGGGILSFFNKEATSSKPRKQ